MSSFGKAQQLLGYLQELNKPEVYRPMLGPGRRGKSSIKREYEDLKAAVGIRDLQDPGPTPGEKWRNEIAREKELEDRALLQGQMSAFLNARSGLSGAARKNADKVFSNWVEAQAPQHSKFISSFLEATPLGPVGQKLESYRENNRPIPAPDISGDPPEMQALKIGQWFSHNWNIKRGESKIKGQDIGPMPRYYSVGEGVMFTDSATGTTRLMSKKNLKLQEFADKAPVATTVEQLIANDGYADWAPGRQVLGAGGKSVLATLQKSIDGKTRVKITPLGEGGEGASAARKSRAAGDKLDDFTSSLTLAYGAFDGEMGDEGKGIPGEVTAIYNRFATASKVAIKTAGVKRGEPGYYKLLSKLAQDTFDNAQPGTIHAVIDGAKLQEDRWPDGFGAGSKMGVLVARKGRWQSFRTKDNVVIRLGFNEDTGRVYDESLQEVYGATDLGELQAWVGSMDVKQLASWPVVEPEGSSTKSTPPQITNLPTTSTPTIAKPQLAPEVMRARKVKSKIRGAVQTLVDDISSIDFGDAPDSPFFRMLKGELKTKIKDKEITKTERFNIIKWLGDLEARMGGNSR